MLAHKAYRTPGRRQFAYLISYIQDRHTLSRQSITPSLSRNRFISAQLTKQNLQASLCVQGERTVATTKDQLPTILIADDDESNRALLAEILGAEQYRIVHAQDGEEAIEVLENGEVDLVLSDVMMPRRSGFAVCRALKSNPDTRLIPVVLVTSDIDDMRRLTEEPGRPKARFQQLGNPGHALLLIRQIVPN